MRNLQSDQLSERSLNGLSPFFTTWVTSDNGGSVFLTRTHISLSLLVLFDCFSDLFLLLNVVFFFLFSDEAIDMLSELRAQEET